MSLINNIIVGMHSVSFGGMWEFLIKPIESNKKESRAYQNALDYLDFVGIDHKFKDRPATEAPYVVQRHAELARAIASSPKLLLLDEPVSGLNNTESRRFQDIIKKIRDKSVTILLVEHDMEFISGTADEITVLNFGKKIAEGGYKDIRTNKEVIDAYLGGGVE
jgi:branched-chain amino acid transport system ATP-binding protein